MTVASVTAELIGIESEFVLADNTAETQTYVPGKTLSLRIGDGQVLRVPTQDTRTVETMLNGKKPIPTRYRIIVEEA